MTTYLLHGGMTFKNYPGNNLFFSKFTELVEKPEVSILLCYWARLKNNWEERSNKDIKRIIKNSSKKTHIHIVSNPNELFAKIAEHDVLYVAGGEAELLEPYYKDLGFLKEKLNNKLYAGSSIGTFLASTNYVLSGNNQDTNRAHQGIGLLPLQTLCHWNIETKKEQKLKLLRKQRLPVLVLNEFEYITLYN